MIRGSKLKAIAAFEFWGAVQRKAYLITTFGMPVFLLLYIGFISLMSFIGEHQQEKRVRVFGVVDRSGVTRLEGDTAAPQATLPPELEAALVASGASLKDALGVAGKSVFRPYEDREEALEDVASERIQGAFVLDEDYIETGRLEVFVPDSIDFKVGDARQALGRLLSERLLQGRVAPEVAERVHQPFAERKEWTVLPDGTLRPRSGLAKVAKFIVPIVFTMLLFLSLVMTSGYLIQATAVEKENKVVEVLLSSAGPDEILFGKLLGLGMAGLIQIFVWFGMILVSGFAAAGTLASEGVSMPWLGIGLAVAFFPAGYLFLGSLILGTGALGGALKEANQLSAIWTLPAAAPLMFLGILISDPHGLLGRILTWIPITTPSAVVFRATIDPAKVAWWEVAGPLLLLLVSTRLAVSLGGRLFRVGILAGSRPRLREVLRQARLSP